MGESKRRQEAGDPTYWRSKEELDPHRYDGERRAARALRRFQSVAIPGIPGKEGVPQAQGFRVLSEKRQGKAQEAMAPAQRTRAKRGARSS